MNDQDHRPGGALFVQDPAKKTNPNQPDFKGHIVLSPESVKALMASVQVGTPPKVEFAAWKKTSAAGKPYLSLKPDTPRPMTQAAPAPRQAPRIDDDPFADDVPF